MKNDNNGELFVWLAMVLSVVVLCLDLFYWRP